jgi:hypothetical protein
MSVTDLSLSDSLKEVNGKTVSALQERGLRVIWYPDGSKTNKGTGAEVYSYGTRRKFSFSLGKYTTVFQAEVYVIKDAQ